MNPLFFLLALLGARGLSSGGGSDGETVKTETTTFTSNLPKPPAEPDVIAEPETPAEPDVIAEPETPAELDVIAEPEEPPAEDPPAEDPPAEEPTVEDPPADDGMDDMDHGGHNMPAIAPPGTGATSAEIETYVGQLFALGETHVHDMTSDKAGEHMAAMNLVPRDASSHVAIGDGDWFDPSIWANGEVPGHDARVLIPDGVTVTYGDVSDARLFTVRVDGTLDFATDTSSQMIFDTFVVSPSGHLIIGTETDPVDPNVDIDLIVANNGPIDTNWDPLLLSRGMLLHGETTIHGAIKDSHEKVDDDPMAGDTSISFATLPEGWQVGDTIVIAGTRYDGYKWSNEEQAKILYPNEDEIRVITQVDDDGTIHFEDPLVHDHDTPRDDLFTSVANYTRNVSIETENAVDAEVYERGHLMFMHSDDVDVRYLEVHELGRTDKSETSVSAGDQDNAFDTNVQGRYSLHLHRTGTDNLEDPAIVIGTSVYGSPGWGYVHHDSNAILENNASFDTFGAGYVAETGNETGAWIDNIAIYAEGISWGAPKNTTDISADTFDTARGGDGFWFQGRMVASVDNVAASVNTGFVYFHRGGDDRMINFDASLFEYPDALYGDTSVNPDDAPILIFQGNETFAAKEGLHIVKANPNQGHDVWSHLDDFTAWSVKSGAHLEYTSHYILTNFDVVGKESTQFSDAEEGISLGNNASEIVIKDATIEGFETGIDLTKHFVRDDWLPEQHNFVVIDPIFIDVAQNYEAYDPALDTVASSGDLPALSPDLQLDPIIMGSGQWGRTPLTGTKTDTLGETDFPGGTDNFYIGKDEAVAILEEDGYWTTSNGSAYFLVDIYFTDRITGDIFYETHSVSIPPDTLSTFHKPWWGYENVVDNGYQDFTTPDGILHAGDTPLDVAIAVPLPEAPTVPETTAIIDEAHMASHTTMTEEMWMDGYTGDDTLLLDIDSGLFVNTGHTDNADLVATGGTTVLATGGAEYDVSSGRTLAIFDAAAKVGFDGDDGGMAILDMEDGATLTLGSSDGEMASIEEFRSGAFGDAPNVQSGIDLGGATLKLDLTGLTADQAGSFTLMDADEIVGLVDAATLEIGGLDGRDANIVIDYVSDSVTLELTEGGTGAIDISTVGDERQSDHNALWTTLTADQGLAENLPLPEEEELLDVA